MENLTKQLEEIEQSNLVMIGEQRGTLWMDARASEGGIFPIDFYKGKERTTFIQWYSNWLDNALDGLKNNGHKS